MKRILVPTDFSEQAENALKVAAQLAKKNESEIYVLNSLELPTHLSSSGDNGAMPESLFFIKLAEKYFEELLKKPYLDGLLIHEAIIGHGEVYKDVNEVVKEKNIDLVIMGSQGTNGFMELFIGSNTEKVVRTSEIPVLVIKNNHEDFKTDNFVSNYLKMVGFGCRKDLSDALLLDDQVIYILTETFRTASPLVRYFE
jgi:nucleotide-binding universal stress UspA family protein